MSLFARTTLRTMRAAPAARFSTTAIAQKGPVESAKDAAKKVDRTVSDAAVSGIEAGEKVAAAAKQTAGIKTEQARQSASQTAEQAKDQAQATAHQGAEKAEGAARQAQGAAQQAQSKTK